VSVIKIRKGIDNRQASDRKLKVYTCIKYLQDNKIMYLTEYIQSYTSIHVQEKIFLAVYVSERDRKREKDWRLERNTCGCGCCRVKW
jgi:hypothetical protein